MRKSKTQQASEALTHADTQQKIVQQSFPIITACDQIEKQKRHRPATHINKDYMPQDKRVTSQRAAMWRPCASPDQCSRIAPTAKASRDPNPLLVSKTPAHPRTPPLSACAHARTLNEKPPAEESTAVETLSAIDLAASPHRQSKQTSMLQAEARQPQTESQMKRR